MIRVVCRAGRGGRALGRNAGSISLTYPNSPSKGIRCSVVRDKKYGKVGRHGRTVEIKIGNLS